MLPAWITRLPTVFSCFERLLVLTQVQLDKAIDFKYKIKCNSFLLREHVSHLSSFHPIYLVYDYDLQYSSV